MSRTTIGYYTVRIGYKSGIYMNWKECKKQTDQYPDALYKKFYTKQQAQEYIDEEKINENRKIKIYTDGYCKKNRTKEAIATEIYAVIRALDIIDNKSDIIIFTDSTYIINCYNIKNPKTNFDLVDRMNELIKAREEETYFKHMKGHS
ncbi:8599_t:CDS:2, partial [Racocetra persica]